MNTYIINTTSSIYNTINAKTTTMMLTTNTTVTTTISNTATEV